MKATCSTRSCARGRTDAPTAGRLTENRQRIVVAIVDEIRSRVGADYRSSCGSRSPTSSRVGRPGTRIAQLTRTLEAHGVSAINTDIGGTRRRCPPSRPRCRGAAFVRFTERLRDEVTIPLIASNRINTPEVAEDVLRRGGWTRCRWPARSSPTHTCRPRRRPGAPTRSTPASAAIRPVLDHAFVGKKVSCLVNPRAGRETDLVLSPTRTARRVAVIGAGRPGCRRGLRRRAWSPRHAVRRRPGDRRPVRHRRTIPARRSSPRRSGTSPVAWRSSA